MPRSGKKRDEGGKLHFLWELVPEGERKAFEHLMIECLQKIDLALAKMERRRQDHLVRSAAHEERWAHELHETRVWHETLISSLPGGRSSGAAGSGRPRA